MAVLRLFSVASKLKIRSRLANFGSLRPRCSESEMLGENGKAGEFDSNIQQFAYLERYWYRLYLVQWNLVDPEMPRRSSEFTNTCTSILRNLVISGSKHNSLQEEGTGKKSPWYSIFFVNCEVPLYWKPLNLWEKKNHINSPPVNDFGIVLSSGFVKKLIF